MDAKLRINADSWKRAQQMAENILREQMAADVGDVNENAVQFVVDWVTSNKAYFGEKAIGQCLGTMSESGNIAYIFPSVLNQALTKAGFSARKTLKYMADKHLITSVERNDNKGKTYTMTKRFDGRVCRFVEFHIGKIAEKQDELEADNAPEPEYTQGSFVDEDGFQTISDSEVDDLPFA